MPADVGWLAFARRGFSGGWLGLFPMRLPLAEETVQIRRLEIIADIWVDHLSNIGALCSKLLNLLWTCKAIAGDGPGPHRGLTQFSNTWIWKFLRKVLHELTELTEAPEKHSESLSNTTSNLPMPRDGFALLAICALRAPCNRPAKAKSRREKSQYKQASNKNVST